MNAELLPYAPVMLKLLQDVLYQDDKHWGMLLAYLTPVQRAFAAIGLALQVDEKEGYAYLTQPDPDADEPAPAMALPRLVRRMALSFDATVLGVLLREALHDFDTRNPDQARLTLSEQEILEKMLPFYPARSDMTRQADKGRRAIQQLVAARFLRRLADPQEERYEVRRILKAKLSADVLVEIRGKLLDHLTEEEA